MPTLILLRDDAVVRRVCLLEGDTKIGRAPGNHLVFPAAAVSRSHAILNRHGDLVTLRDLDSTNGTFVNLERVTARPLLDGDTIHICVYEMLYLGRDEPDAEIVDEPAPREPASDPPETQNSPLPTPSTPTGEPGHMNAPPPGATWVGNGVAFSLRAQGREIPALITSEALFSHFGVFVHADDGASRAVAAYEENHVAINVVAWSRFNATHREPILIRASDF